MGSREHAMRLVTLSALVALTGGITPMAAADILRVTAGDADLTEPMAEGERVLRYGLGFPFQVGPTTAAVFCNLRVEQKHVYDFEYGTDAILFGDLASIDATNAVPVSRNEEFAHAETDAPWVAVKYPVIGGFVPLGAKLADGSAHPHAGTGFGICQSISFPLQEDGSISWKTERTHAMDVHQLAYDGAALSSELEPALPHRGHPPIADTGWEISAPGITNAIPDGRDLLEPLAAYDGRMTRSGVCRWRRDEGRWQPVDFAPVSDPGQSWSEASLVRLADGRLLSSARGYGDTRTNAFRVWLSTDGGANWEVVIDRERAREEAPVALNIAADGTPYLGGCLLGHSREILCIWPIDVRTWELRGPVVTRNSRGDFGPPPGGKTWMVDHPSGAVVRLADGGWHGLLAYRVLQYAEFSGADPAPQSGCYVEEVISSGGTVAPWRFE